MSQCQLYKYNATFYTIKKENSEFFGSSFSENELDNDHVAWLNFHGLDDTKSIEELCHRLDIDKLTNENIHTSIRRPKIEEYPKYMFFQIKSALPTEKNEDLLNQEQISFILGSRTCMQRIGARTSTFNNSSSATIELVVNAYLIPKPALFTSTSISFCSKYCSTIAHPEFKDKSA